MNNEVTPDSSERVPRRGMMKSVAAAVLGGTVAIVPLIPGIAFFLNPLLRKRETGEAGAGAAEKKDADGYIRMAIGAEKPEGTYILIYICTIYTHTEVRRSMLYSQNILGF